MNIEDKVFVVESHHQVLEYWARLRCELEEAPRLLTFDHHTDTAVPFRKFLRQYYGVSAGSANFEGMQNLLQSRIDYRVWPTIVDAMEKLGNDEHVVAAIKSNIISSALVIAQNAANTNDETFLEHRIMCREVVKSTDVDLVLTDAFLALKLSSIDEQLKALDEATLLERDFILDIDLDYFNTRRALQPASCKTFQKLAREARMITIAKEPDFVRTCAVDKDLTSEIVLEKLMDILKSKPLI